VTGRLRRRSRASKELRGGAWWTALARRTRLLLLLSKVGKEAELTGGETCNLIILTEILLKQRKTG
jgi:hypothetical protein